MIASTSIHNVVAIEARRTLTRGPNPVLCIDLVCVAEDYPGAEQIRSEIPLYFRDHKAGEAFYAAVNSLAPPSPPIPSNKPCCEVNPKLWADFCRAKKRANEHNDVWSEADVVQFFDTLDNNSENS